MSRKQTVPLDPFKDLDKRERLTLRQALQDGDGTGAAPAEVVKKLERKHLVRRTGHMHSAQEWGKVVRRWPVFALTAEGTKIAKEIVDTLYGPPGGTPNHSTIKTGAQLDAEIAVALRAKSAKSAMRPAILDPYRNSQQDVRDAFEYMRESFDDWSADACFTEKRETLPLSKILNYDDYGSWGEWSPGELRGMKGGALLGELTGFRGRAWAETAAGWVTTRGRTNIPAVVLFDSSQHGTAVADGRGRVSLAVGLSIPRLHVIRIVDCNR